MIAIVTTVVGWFGMICILCAYNWDRWYLHLTGALCLAVYAISHEAWPNVGNNIVWFMITLRKLFIARATKPPDG